jgi:hypothetical protein
MEATNTSETPVNFYRTTRRNIPEDSHLHKRSYMSVYQIIRLISCFRYLRSHGHHVAIKKQKEASYKNSGIIYHNIGLISHHAHFASYVNGI